MSKIKCNGRHQWKKQMFNRIKCMKCGKIQRQNNTTMNRIARARRLGKKLTEKQKLVVKYGTNA